MTKEVIAKAPTTAQAIQEGCEQLGVSELDASIEILQQPKKSFFGLKVTPAIVKVSVEVPDEVMPKAVLKEEKAPKKDAESAKPKNERTPKRAETKADGGKPKQLVSLVELEVEPVPITMDTTYLESLLLGMGLTKEHYTLKTVSIRNGSWIILEGDEVEFLVGQKGEVLDALQMLVNLEISQRTEAFQRVFLDCNGYRQKRDARIIALAKKLAEKTASKGGSVTLEPMNPYERRLVHSVVQSIEGVSSHSLGTEPRRCVVIVSDKPMSQVPAQTKPKSRHRGGRRRPRKEEKKMPSNEN